MKLYPVKKDGQLTGYKGSHVVIAGSQKTGSLTSYSTQVMSWDEDSITLYLPKFARSASTRRHIGETLWHVLGESIGISFAGGDITITRNGESRPLAERSDGHYRITRIGG